MKKLITLLIIVVSTQALYSFDWSKHELNVESTIVQDSETIITIKDKNEKVFTVKYYNEISDENANSIIKLQKSFDKWRYMKVGSLKFVISNDIIEIVIIPSKFVYNNKNIVPYLPAGMLFIYNAELKYNFRMTKNNLFVRIKGRFKDERKFCRNLLYAVNYPHKYLKKRDPEYFLTKLTQLENNLQSLENRHGKLLRKHNALIKKHDQLKEVFNVFNSEHITLKASHDKLVNAVLVFENTGFLGFGNSEIKKSLAGRIISLKKANPKWKKKEISAALDKEKIKNSGQEIELILAVYFNEFE